MIKQKAKDEFWAIVDRFTWRKISSVGKGICRVAGTGTRRSWPGTNGSRREGIPLRGEPKFMAWV